MSRWNPNEPIPNGDHVTRRTETARAVVGERADRRRVSEAETFSDATFAAAISTRGITYGFWITKARCRTRRKIKRNSATGSSARARGACEFGRRNVLVSSRRRMTTLLLLIQHRAEVARVELS
jgi:hypothetical protein